jgi:hypothetical protein
MSPAPAADRRPASLLRAMAELEPLLATLGYALAQEHYDHAGAGSAFVVYARRGGRLRLSWDGRDGTLRAETAPVQLDNWRDIESEASRPGRVPDRAAGEQRLVALRSAIERLPRIPQLG